MEMQFSAILLLTEGGGHIRPLLAKSSEVRQQAVPTPRPVKEVKLVSIQRVRTL